MKIQTNQNLQFIQAYNLILIVVGFTVELADEDNHKTAVFFGVN